ncbi:MAG: leucyl aminopeptidase [Agarilytica sp.]
MDFFAKNSDISKLKTQCAVVFTFNNNLCPSAKILDDKHNQLLSQQIKSKDLDENAGSCAWVTVPNETSTPYQRVLLINLGKPSKAKTANISVKTWSKVANTLIAVAGSRAIKDIAVFLDNITLQDEAQSPLTLTKILSEAGVKASYRYDATKNKVKGPVLQKVTAVTSALPAARKGLAYGKALGSGVNTARNLGNLPGNICTPSYLGTQAKRLAEKHSKLSVKVLGEKQMEKLGMGSFLSVSNGSDEEGKLVIMEFKNGRKDAKPHVLVGKGVTFDTGGISLKPGAAMDEMKFDMCGAASVFGALTALVEMDAPVNVIGLVAAAENMPSGRATKPGDVVTSMSGKTIEVLNTDAEGRLVLCDTLTYAERYQPKSVVDIATLTGACVVALGSHATGLFSNNEKLADALLASGEKTLDRAWRMPLWDEYQKQLDSNFADMANIGGREAGSVTAACFLSRYAEKYPWAHLDIAGTAWNSGAKKGATGRPVNLLVDYLLNN